MEFRLDQLNDRHLLRRITEKKSFPAIATDKSSRASTRQLLDEAAAAGFEFVDIDLSSDGAEQMTKRLKSHGVQVILSFHDYSKTPSIDELRKVLDSERKVGGDVCKIVTTCAPAT